MQGRYDLGGGGYFHMKETGMFLISLRGIICIVLFQVGSSGRIEKRVKKYSNQFPHLSGNLTALIWLPFLSVVCLTVQISKAWATPRLVSLKGLILIFQQASPYLSYRSPPTPLPPKTGGYIIRGKPWVSTLCFLFAVSLRPGHMRHVWCVTGIMHCARSTVTCTALQTQRTSSCTRWR